MASSNWLDYLESGLDGEISSQDVTMMYWDDELLQLANRVNGQAVNHPDKLLQMVGDLEEGGNNMVIILPGAGKTFRYLHSMYAADSRIWGIHGIQATAAIMEAPKNKLCESLRLPDKGEPSWKELIKCEDVESFRKLKGKKPESETKQRPSFCAIPKALFLSKFVTDGIDAAEVAVSIILDLDEDDEEHEGIKDLLILLWAIAKGSTQSISLAYHPHKPTEADLKGSDIIALIHRSEWPDEESRTHQESRGRRSPGKSPNSESKKSRGRSRTPRPSQSDSDDDGRRTSGSNAYLPTHTLGHGEHPRIRSSAPYHHRKSPNGVVIGNEFPDIKGRTPMKRPSLENVFKTLENKYQKFSRSDYIRLRQTNM